MAAAPPTPTAQQQRQPTHLSHHHTKTKLFLTQKKVEAQLGEGKALSNEGKRQILADIMVWAEVTQPHYDAGTARCVICVR